MVELVREERLDFGDARAAQRREDRIRDFGVGVRDDLTRRFVDDGLREGAAEDVVVRNGNFGDAGLGEVAHVLRRDALVARHDDLAFVVDDVERHHLALHALGHKGERRAQGLQAEAVEFEEALEDFLGGVAQGLQEDRAGHLAATVDAEVENVLRVEFEVKPRAAVRNHARGEEKLAGRVRLALVVLEEDAGGAVQLADDDALGPVDDEGALLRHERDFAHVHVVFADFLDRAGFGGVTVVNLEADLRAQAAAVGETAQLALGDVEFRLGQGVVLELEAGVAVVAQDREDGGERGLQTDVFVPCGRGHVVLQEVFVGAKLGFEQGGHFKDARTRGKALPDALLFSERVRHGDSVRH